MSSAAAPVNFNSAGATMPGGSTNQDTFFILPGLVAVLDGASAIGEASAHDGGWYASALSRAFRRSQEDSPALSLRESLFEAITDLTTQHDLEPGNGPSSTIAAVRIRDNSLETLLLGDSTIVVLRRDRRDAVITDNRMAAVGTVHRERYTNRLRAGTGFDAEHRDTLRMLQADQRAQRNTTGGYWISEADPAAARHALVNEFPLKNIIGCLMLSDGAAAAVTSYGSFSTWRDVFHAALAEGPLHPLETATMVEKNDPRGERWPRSKRHDDKTLVACWTSGYAETHTEERLEDAGGPAAPAPT